MPCVAGRCPTQLRAMLCRIDPKLYESWVSTIVECVREHDPQSTEMVETAWCEVLEPGIELMKSLY